MEATNTMMRKTMVAVSLVAMTACGSSGNGGDDGDDGVGGGTCSSGSECGETEACDMVAHVCVADALTIDPSDFVVQSSIWWTSTTEPTLRGTFEGDSTSMIEVRIGAQGTKATLQGSTWSVKLATNSISTSNTQVTISKSDDSGGLVEAVRSIGLDTAPPGITIAPSPVRDERGDAVEFSSGEPVHSHDGPSIDLATGTCPDIYKYAYLMSANDPAFGRQTARNPLAWNIAIAEAKLDPAGTAYRVRNATGQVVLDWTSIAKTADDRYTIELFHDGEHGIRALGTTEGQFTLDIRARDWTGLESVINTCWTHHPLVAPLEFEQLSAAGGAGELFAMSLAADSPIGSMMGTGMGTVVANQRFVQYTAEPVAVAVTKASSAIAYRTQYVDDYLQVGTAPGGVCDDFSGTPVTCDTSPVPDPVDVVSTGAVGTHDDHVRILDETTGLYLEAGGGGWLIPARGANEAPHAYRIVVALGGAVALRPSPGAIPSERSFAGRWYTGLPMTEYIERCTAVTTRQGISTCASVIQYGRMVALDNVELTFDPMSLTVRTAAANIGWAPQTYAPASKFTTPTLSWNGGDDDLPGPK